MDVKWVAMILLGAAGTGRVDAAEMLQVEVYVQQNDWKQPLGFTEQLASQIFGRINVRLNWHAGRLPPVPCTGRRCIGIRMMEYAPLSLTAGALASARPFGSSSESLISVYEDRLQHVLHTIPSLSRVLLAYVFVHELAHMMMGCDYHSDSGILKAQWSQADGTAMLDYHLGFTNSDAERIRGGLGLSLSADLAK